MSRKREDEMVDRNRKNGKQGKNWKFAYFQDWTKEGRRSILGLNVGGVCTF